MRMPLDLLRLDPSERHVSFKFDELRRDSSLVPRDKSAQFQLHNLVDKRNLVHSSRMMNADKQSDQNFNVAIV